MYVFRVFDNVELVYFTSNQNLAGCFATRGQAEEFIRHWSTVLIQAGITDLNLRFSIDHFSLIKIQTSVEKMYDQFDAEIKRKEDMS